MINKIILDTETTSLVDPRMIQLAYISSSPHKKVNKMFRPDRPIEFGAMAISHITNEMVAGLEPFSESQEKIDLIQEVESGVVIAHNAPFDVAVLANDGVTCKRVIDTKRCAQHLFAYDGRYSLQELRYAMGLYKQIDNTNALAHDAMGDVIVLEVLFNELFGMVQNLAGVGTDEHSVIEHLEKLSVTPCLIKKVAFGKYSPRGSHSPVEKSFYTWEDLSKFDPDYMRWLVGSELKKPEEERNADLLHTLNYYLNAL